MRIRKPAIVLLATVGLVAGALGGVALPVSARPTPAATITAVTPPTNETARSLYTNNWSDTVGLWMASKLAQTDTNTQYGPRLAELHYSPNGPGTAMQANQIVDYTGYFRDETNAIKYNQANSFDASGYLDSGGILRTDYRSYNGAPTSVAISRDYATVPNQHFTVVTYRLRNSGTTPVDVSVLDSVHVNNLGKASGAQMHASYDSTRRAALVDMSASGQYQLVLGSFGAPGSYQVGDDTNRTAGSPTISPWFAFDANGYLPNNGDVRATEVSVGMTKRVTVPAGQTVATSFYLAIANTQANVLAAADTANTKVASDWENTTTQSYTDWLNAGQRASFADTGLSTAYDRALVAIKAAVNPALGTWPATTNPIAYGYKSWARDSAVTAMSLDASGHYAETDKYFRWLASVQNADGTFGTTFDVWTGQRVPFVEPEHDAIGIFLLGVLRHYQRTGDTAFRDALWPAVVRSADFVLNHLDTNGFGPKDASIWEEQQEYNTFTQGLYVAGLWAASQLAQSKSDTAHADYWSDVPASILTATQRSSLNSPAGLWNAPDLYYNRAVNADNTARTLVDASSDILLALGIVDPASSRAASHVAKIKAALTHDTWGISRYTGDTFYYTSPYSPAGDEAKAAEPSWPQMSCYLALYETYTGDRATALNRLTWYVSRTATGYMPPGEAVSNVTRLPIVSTMVEPVTGAWYVLAALTYLGKTDPRVVAPVAKAGANATITVSAGTTGDWPQWNPVPYYLTPVGDNVSRDPATDIKNVAVANDANNVYLRIDNAGGTLPAFDTAPRFAVTVYAADFAGNTSTPTLTTSLYGASLGRPVSYLVGRWSNSNTFSRFVVRSGAWAVDSAVSGVIAPQWDPASGRIELAVPRSALASAAPADGNTATLIVNLVRQNPTTGVWSDDDTITLRYRLTGSSTPWIYGNVR